MNVMNVMIMIDFCFITWILSNLFGAKQLTKPLAKLEKSAKNNDVHVPIQTSYNASRRENPYVHKERNYSRKLF